MGRLVYVGVILWTILLLIFITSGCSGSGGEDQLKEKLLEGTSGLVITPLEKGLSSDVVEDGTVHASFELRNEGYFDIFEGILIPSYEQDLVSFVSWDMPREFRAGRDNSATFSLNGKRIYDTQGEKQIVRMLYTAKEIDDTRTKIDTSITLTSCYAYGTVLSETMCVDTDPSDLGVARKSCEASDISTSSQGAPVAITKVEQRIVPGNSPDSVRVQLNIYAENKGDGVILNFDRFRDVCLGSNIGENDYNVIFLQRLEFSDYSLGGEIECVPNPMRETENGYYTRCLLREENSIPKSTITYQTPLLIELAYGYKTSSTEEITILNRDAEVI